MDFVLPPSFWPTVYRLAVGTSAAWPPEDDYNAERFIQRVVPEGLLSLLLAESALPPAVSRAVEKFQALDRTNRLRSQVFESCLRTVVDLLAGEQIVIIKGTDYAYRWYPAPHLRPRQDIDILVQRERAAAIASRLRAAGHTQYFPAGAVTRVRSHHEAVFGVGHATVEVHHSFIQRARNRVDYQGIWQRATQWSGFDHRLLRLDDVDALLAHAINMGVDEFSNPIFRHLDLWLMLHDRQDLLPTAVSRSREWATTRSLYAALRQSTRHIPELRTPAVEKAMEELLPRRTRVFLDRRVLPDPWQPRKRYGRVGKLWKKYWLIDDGRLRVSFALYHAWALIAGKFLEIRDRRGNHGFLKTNRLFKPSWNRRRETHSSPAAENNKGVFRGSNP